MPNGEDVYNKGLKELFQKRWKSLLQLADAEKHWEKLEEIAHADKREWRRSVAENDDVQRALRTLRVRYHLPLNDIDEALDFITGGSLQRLRIRPQ